MVEYGKDGGIFKTVSESQYKRHNYTMAGLGLLMGLAGWCIVANAYNRESDPSGTLPQGPPSP